MPLRKRRRTQIAGQFAPRLIAMLESPAYRVMSLAGHRVLARVEIELAAHGGTENGRLPVTHKNFVDYAIHDHAVAPALREVVALGFLEITQRGQAGAAEFRSPHKFRLTYRPTDTNPATDDWRKFTTIEEAEAVAKAARAKTESHWRIPPNVDGGNRQRKPDSLMAESASTVSLAESASTLDISGASPASGGTDVKARTLPVTPLVRRAPQAPSRIRDTPCPDTSGAPTSVAEVKARRRFAGEAGSEIGGDALTSASTVGPVLLSDAAEAKNGGPARAREKSQANPGSVGAKPKRRHADRFAAGRDWRPKLAIPAANDPSRARRIEREVSAFQPSS